MTVEKRKRDAFSQTFVHFHSAEVLCVATTSTLLATGDASGNLKLWHKGSLEAAGGVDDALNGNVPLSFLDSYGKKLLGAGGLKIAVVEDGRVAFCAEADGSRVLEAKWVASGSFVALTERGGALWRGGKGCPLYASANLLSSESLGPQLCATSLGGGAPKGRETFATGGADGRVNVWCGRSHAASFVAHPSASITSMAFFNNSVATGAFDGSIKLWDSSVADPLSPPVVIADPLGCPGAGHWAITDIEKYAGPPLAKKRWIAGETVAPLDLAFVEPETVDLVKTAAPAASLRCAAVLRGPAGGAVSSLAFSSGDEKGLLAAFSDGGVVELATDGAAASTTYAAAPGGAANAVAPHPGGEPEAATAGGGFKLWDTSRHALVGIVDGREGTAVA